MELDNLVISLLDSDAMKGCFKKELASKLNLPIICIADVWLQTKLVDGVAMQELYVAFVDNKISREDLMKIPFDYIYENCIVFEVGDTIL